MSTGLGKKNPIRKADAGGRGAQYIDLGATTYDDEQMSSHAGSTVKIAEIYRYEDIKNLVKHLYDGHNLIIDYSSLANDDTAMKRITSDLASVAEDINGDVAGIGHNLLLVTANGIRIDRQKIRGSF